MARKQHQTANPSSRVPSRLCSSSFLVLLICLLGCIIALFHQSFHPDFVIFSNDGPLGALSAASSQLPSSFIGMWQDLNWLGTAGGSFAPNITAGLFWLLGPLGFAKFYPPLTILMLGLCAWFFFRRLKLVPLAGLLGTLAAALNSDFLSVSCWGVGPQTICFGLNYLALGLLVTELPRWRWLRFVLAGLALGMAVTEGADIGAIFSLCFAAFVFYSGLTSEGPAARKVARSFGGLALVAGFALF